MLHRFLIFIRVDSWHSWLRISATLGCHVERGGTFKWQPGRSNNRHGNSASRRGRSAVVQGRDHLPVARAGVRDSNGDGIGDFRGLTEKLDYIRDLGVTAIWLLPFFPSPLRDDGYDTSDYVGVNPIYGSLRDFKAFLREAHRRDLRVITEMVMNHTSDQHEWFQKSRRAQPGEKWRDFYVWSDTPDRYREARVIFQDFEQSNWTWDPVAQAYYWHRFYHHQPDLNYDNPEVRRAMLNNVDYWLRMGVDAFRLDAVPTSFSVKARTARTCRRRTRSSRMLRRHVDSHFADKMLLAEANQWPEDAAAYFGDGDECHMNFHFPIMPRLFMAIEREDRFPITDILEQTPAIPETCQWGIFLRNHDELTLEMVTDEERDYMYRAYAEDPQARLNLGIRRRLAPLLKNHRRKIELMNALLLSLPGTPIIYYGDELGMGDNVYLGDRDGVRTPMQWNADRNAGFSRANPQRLYLPPIIDAEYHYAALNVEVQQNSPHSLLWWMRRIIGLRKQFLAFGRGTMEILLPDNPKVLAFLRQHGRKRCWLSPTCRGSRSARTGPVAISRADAPGAVRADSVPADRRVAVFPHALVPMPSIGFGWPGRPKRRSRWAWSCRPARSPAAGTTCFAAPRGPNWNGPCRRSCAGNGGLAARRGRFKCAAGRCDPRAGTTGNIGHATAARAGRLRRGRAGNVPPAGRVRTWPAGHDIIQDHPRGGILRVERSDGIEPATLCEAIWEEAFWHPLYDAIARKKSLPGEEGEIASEQTKVFRDLSRSMLRRGEPEIEARRTDIHVGERGASHRRRARWRTEQHLGGPGDRFILKVFRRLGVGENPDLEIGRFLTEHSTLTCVPDLAGAVTYQPKDGGNRNRVFPGGGRPMTIGIMHELVPNEGDAWVYTLDELGRYVERVESEMRDVEPDSLVPGRKSLLELAHLPLPHAAAEMIGSYVQSAELLGRRTAQTARGPGRRSR
jgi:maltose alpha-D-glucosyltransferase / alpha-amylase